MDYIRCNGVIYVKSKMTLNNSVPLYYQYKKGTNELFTLEHLKNYEEIPELPAVLAPEYTDCLSDDILHNGDIITFDEYSEIEGRTKFSRTYNIKFKELTHTFGIHDFVFYKPYSKDKFVYNMRYDIYSKYSKFIVIGKKNGKFLIKRYREHHKYNGNIMSANPDIHFGRRAEFLFLMSCPIEWIGLKRRGLHLLQDREYRTVFDLFIGNSSCVCFENVGYVPFIVEDVYEALVDWNINFFNRSYFLKAFRN